MPIEKPQYLINVCASFRVKGEAKGICHKKGSHNLLGYFEEGILDRDIDARIVSTGCMKQCEEGPIVVVMPENWWLLRNWLLPSFWLLHFCLHLKTIYR